jgi:energy-coupling factor transporter ATP-binding protein EcfA2
VSARAHRWVPLRAALWFALGFVALRVAYRVAFGGASGSGAVLWSIDSIALPAPFSGVRVLGTVTLGGLWATVLAALPLAAVIVGFGLLNSLVDARRLLTRTRRLTHGRVALTAAAIALATYPALLESTRRVRLARRLRRERSLRSLLIPVFELALERSVALATAMDTRGFGADSRVVPACSRAIEAVDFGVRHRSGTGSTWQLQGVHFALAPGSVTVLTGPTGSGKTTLLRACAGLAEHADGAEVSGLLRVGGLDRSALLPHESAHFVSLVGQDARAGFVAPTVREELGFGPAAQGEAPGRVDVLVGEVLAQLRLEHLADREVEQLSAGEATLVAIGAALVSRPSVLLLDEPIADLDAAACERVVGVLRELAAGTGITIVIAEHRVAPLLGIATGWMRIEGDRVLTEAPPAPVALGEVLAATSVLEPDFTLQPGEIVALVGPNGVGKTTFLTRHALAHPEVALVPERYGDLLFRESVAEEWAAARARGGDAEQLMRQILGGDVAQLAALHPRDISAGQRLALVCALQLARSPEVLLVDEPTRGLDPRARVALGEVVARIAATGTPVVFATHDAEFAARVAHSVCALAPIAPLATGESPAAPAHAEVSI